MTETVFCYPLGDYRIVLESGIRSEVLSQPTLYPVPFAPVWCAGLTSVRGDLCVVLDLHQVLFNQSRPAKQQWLSLQADSFQTVVIGCDDLPKAIPKPDQSAAITPPSSLPGWVVHVWQEPQGLLLAVDHARLFSLLSRTK